MEWCEWVNITFNNLVIPWNGVDGLTSHFNYSMHMCRFVIHNPVVLSFFVTYHLVFNKLKRVNTTGATIEASQFTLYIYSLHVFNKLKRVNTTGVSNEASRFALYIYSFCVYVYLIFLLIYIHVLHNFHN